MEQLPEDSGAFWSTFNAETAKTRATLESPSIAASDCDSIRNHLVVMQTYATQSTSILPPYDIRRTQEILDAVGKDLREIEGSLKPRKKFSFSTKSKDKLPIASVTKDVPSLPIAAHTPAASKDAEGGFTLRDKTAGSTGIPPQVYLLTETELGKTSDGVLPPILVTHCSGITVSARCLLGAVRLENCTACQIVLGPCSTSVYLEDCSDCTVFLASHQLRIHKCTGCTLYVRVNSHPIIEDCSMMRFAPYPLEYDLHAAHVREAALREAKCWDNVVDFRWHRSTPSPNWTSIPLSERITELQDVLKDAGWRLADAQVPAIVEPVVCQVNLATEASIEGNLSELDREEEI